MALCKIAQILATCSSPEHTRLLSVLTGIKPDGSYLVSAKRLAKAINQTEYSVGPTTIKDHRNRECACAK